MVMKEYLVGIHMHQKIIGRIQSIYTLVKRAKKENEK